MRCGAFLSSHHNVVASYQVTWTDFFLPPSFFHFISYTGWSWTPRGWTILSHLT
jgi:hypothetical protein